MQPVFGIVDFIDGLFHRGNSLNIDYRIRHYLLELFCESLLDVFLEEEVDEFLCRFRIRTVVDRLS